MLLLPVFRVQHEARVCSRCSINIYQMEKRRAEEGGRAGGTLFTLPALPALESVRDFLRGLEGSSVQLGPIHDHLPSSPAGAHVAASYMPPTTGSSLPHKTAAAITTRTLSSSPDPSHPPGD